MLDWSTVAELTHFDVVVGSVRRNCHEDVGFQHLRLWSFLEARPHRPAKGPTQLCWSWSRGWGVAWRRASGLVRGQGDWQMLLRCVHE